MSVFKQQLSRTTKIQLAVVCAIILLAGVLLVLDFIFKGPITYLFTNKDEVVDVVRSLGIFGPLFFVLIHAFQTVVTPIPGNVTGAVGGYLFGWWGILWTTIGSIIGFWIVFWLARRFGRGLVEKIIKKESLDKFDYLTKEKGSTLFFLIFLIPGLPDDVVGYIAGLTTIPIRTLLVLAIVGRTPAVIATNMLGAGIGEEDITPVIIIAAISAIVCIAAAVKHEAIMRYFKLNQKNKK